MRLRNVTPPVAATPASRAVHVGCARRRRRRSYRVVRIVLILLAILTSRESATAGEWKAGVARVMITPTTPLWMTGYASRNRPAEGKLHELWAKALALEDAS